MSEFNVDWSRNIAQDWIGYSKRFGLAEEVHQGAITNDEMTRVAGQLKAAADEVDSLRSALSKSEGLLKEQVALSSRLMHERDEAVAECATFKRYHEYEAAHVERLAVVNREAMAILGGSYPAGVVDRATALVAERNEAMAEVERMRAVYEAAVKMPDRLLPVPGDWACWDCRPYSDMLIDGFRCQTHALKAAIDVANHQARGGECVCDDVPSLRHLDDDGHLPQCPTKKAPAP